MIRHAAIAILCRALPLLAVGFALALLAPGLFTRPTALLAGPVLNGSARWMERATFRVEDHAFHIEGTIRLPLQLADGRALPDIPGRWRQGVQPILALFVTALVTSVLTDLPLRRRLIALAVTVPLLYLLASVDLAINAQHAALERLGHEVIPSIPLSDTPENHTCFQALERRYKALSWIKAFTDAGGRLLIAALLPLLCAALIAPRSWLGAR